ncbi:DUF2062 domain-containing protein [Rhodobacter sp. CCP-1]|uniref:DUF2062 domain-containing protein n=2 Tax=Paragemmobacter ruber TaxID=1985673 RepID=A0ABW9Y2Y6_9RHOB|nr:DUF2062 domain-containing protein [Rhodobacter ruber]
MVFKRRNPRTLWGWTREMVYPQGGFRRATQYVLHRMRRLPDSPHRIARGVFAGSMVGFLPLPGMQFLAAWLACRLVKGNLLAALLATFNTNPITTPFFAVLAMTLGHWMLGIQKPLSPEYIGEAFANAGSDLWFNVKALFGPAHTQWDGLAQFWHEIYLPYFLGALGPGLLLSVLFYYLTIPLVTAYQKARAAKSKERSERRRKLREAIENAAARLKHLGEGSRGPGDDDAAGPT